VSDNPMQRIADLEAQVAALTAENSTLRTRSNGKGHLDAGQLADALGLRIDRAGQLLREDFTGKLAGMIAPYIEKTIKDCAEVAQRQLELERKFAEHRQAVAGSAAEMTAAFIKLRKEAAKDWKAQREQMQQDLGRVDAFAKWFRAELQAHGQQHNAAVASCNRAVSACQDLAEKMSVPLTQTIEYLNNIKVNGEATINSAARQLTSTYNNLRQPVLTRVTVLLFAAIFIQMAFGGFILWRTRVLINTNWQELTEHSEQQKQDMKTLLDKTMAEAKEAQIDKEIKVKLWDAFLKSLSSQQRQAVLEKYRMQVGDAERKRIADQMSAGYEQMNGTR
jgi:hypothetical protein